MPIERKLAAIMFTDIAGYTALSAKDSTKASELLKTQRHTLKPIVEKHGGSWMKEIGDGLLLTFDSATSAVECSIAIQVATKDIEDLNLRIGIHEGEVIRQDGDVIGDDVNVASRIEPFSAEGGVAISDKIYRAISSNSDFETKYIGKPKLKGVSQEVKVYCITSHGLPQTDVSKVSAKLEEESKFNIFALTGGILTAIGIAFWIAVGVFDVSFGGKAEVPSVGILMMENLGKEDEEFWSSGMTADLITKVAGAGLIRVAPLDDILKLDKDLSIEEKAKKLRVKYILTHQFLIKDEGFDLWCKLENTENGVALFSNKISEPMDMATQMVGKLANDIVTSLKVETKQDVMKAPTNNAEAYEYYLKGKYKWKKRKTKEDIDIVRGLYKRAIELDENLIKAKTSLAFTYFVLGDFNKAKELYISSLNKAEEINDSISFAWSLKGLGMVYGGSGEWEKEFAYVNKAKNIFEKIGDKNGVAHSIHSLGNYYNSIGNYEAALENYKQSLNINRMIGNQNSVTLLTIGFAYQYMGKLDSAYNYFNHLENFYKEENNDFRLSIVYGSLGQIYLDKNNYQKSIQYSNKSLEIINVIGSHPDAKLRTSTLLYLAQIKNGITYDNNKFNNLIQENKDYWNNRGVPIFEDATLPYYIYQLLNDTSYLETAYNQIQEKADNLEPDVAAKFLSYPIPKAIVEEWEKVK